MRDDLHSSDDNNDEELFEDPESDVDCGVHINVNDHDVAADGVTDCDDASVDDTEVDSDDSDDYNPPQDIGHDTSPRDSNTVDVIPENGGGDNADDGTDIMWSRCGSVAWKTRAPTMSRYQNHNILTEERSPGLPQDMVVDSTVAAF